MTTPSLATLIKDSTKEAFFSLCLSTFSALGVRVTSWQKDDPTRALTYAQSIRNESFSQFLGGGVRAGWLDLAPDVAIFGDDSWLTLIGRYVYNVERIRASQARMSVKLTNSGPQVYNFSLHQITVKNPTTGKTFTNVETGSLFPGSERTLIFEASEPGSASNTSAGVVDSIADPTSIVTTFAGVDVLNTTAAVGDDLETRVAFIDRCKAKLGTLSPNGPAAAVRYVALTPKYNGGVSIERATVVPDSSTGQGTIYIAGASGNVTSDERDAVEVGILRYATPLCFTPIVLSATPVVFAVTQTIYVYEDLNVPDVDLVAAFKASLDVVIKERPIGGDKQPPSDQGWLYRDVLHGAAYRAVLDVEDQDQPLRLGPYVFRVATGTPATDTMLDPEECPIPGAHTVNVVKVPRGAS